VQGEDAPCVVCLDPIRRFGSFRTGNALALVDASPERLSPENAQFCGRILVVEASSEWQDSLVHGSSNLNQAATLPEALATWVAIASIKAGDRQS
jgi:hypothetical protein